MADMPKVNFRDMPGKLTALTESHKQHHQRIHDLARKVEAERIERDRELNAKARLDGRTT